jgi:protoheme IX farnesyltransferase
MFVTAGQTTAPSFFAALRRTLSGLLQLTKPSLMLMVVVTTLLGLHLGSNGDWPWALAGWTLLGTALSGGGACGINMALEHEADAQMRRTAKRPIPAGHVSPFAAFGFSLALLFIGNAVLWRQANPLTALLSMMAAAVYVLLYTPLKRATPMATWLGAIPGALPPVMGFTAVRGVIDTQAVIVFGILFFWQLPHFWALAVMYQEDYTRGGFKVQPIAGAHFDRARLENHILWATATLLVVSVLLFVRGDAGWIYLAGALLAGGLFMQRAVVLRLSHRVADARRLFYASLIYQPVLVAALVLDKPQALMRALGLSV